MEICNLCPIYIYIYVSIFVCIFSNIKSTQFYILKRIYVCYDIALQIKSVKHIYKKKLYYFELIFYIFRFSISVTMHKVGKILKETSKLFQHNFEKFPALRFSPLPNLPNLLQICVNILIYLLFLCFSYHISLRCVINENTWCQLEDGIGHNWIPQNLPGFRTFPPRFKTRNQSLLE